MYTKKQVLQQFAAMGMKWYQYPIEWIKLTFCRKYRDEWLNSNWMVNER